MLVAGFQIRKRFLFPALIAAAICLWMLARTPFGHYQTRPMDSEKNSSSPDSSVPLDHRSPWPKFRANALQNGRSGVIPRPSSGSRPWKFRTGKGIFSSPVIDEEGTIYIGSADHYFYAIRKDGSLKWKTATGEIIDSSALLDDGGHVYFGSGDAHLYSLNRVDGSILWKTRSHTVKEVEEQFGLKTYNLDWFEGNVAMQKDGALIAPNDNYLVYTFERESGKIRGHMIANELLWSLPAVNPETNRIFFGSNFVLLKNVFAFDNQNEQLWTAGGLGSNAASVLLTSSSERGALVVGGFDGYVRAYTQDSGKELWKFGTRDHIYASPAQLADGTIIQPSSDGTVYAIDPDTGRQIWAFDTMEPIRSSPAVDGNGTIYVGSGEGKLFAINPDGKLRWAYQLIDEDRNDLNSSPALGPEGICIGGESGEVFFVPYDYPLSVEGKTDIHSFPGPEELLPSDGIHLIYTTPFGGLRLRAPESIDANQPLAFTLFAREKGDTKTSHLDQEIFATFNDSDQKARINVSADGRFVLLIPQESWMVDPQTGELSVTLRGHTLENRSRFGLKFFGGNSGPEFRQTFHFKIIGHDRGPEITAASNGGRGTVFEFSRLSVPNPTMLPSWNQIGFDSLHYLASVVEYEKGKGVVWVIPGKLDTESGKTIVNASLKDRFVLNFENDEGVLTLYNYDPFKLSFVGSWDMPFGLYRIGTRLDSAKSIWPASLSAVALGDEIAFYGKFLKILGMTDFRTGHMHILGGMNLSSWDSSGVRISNPAGSIDFSLSKERVVVELKDSVYRTKEHVFGILLVDALSGKAIPADYARGITVEENEQGMARRIELKAPEAGLHGNFRVYLMVDTIAVKEYSGSI